MFCRNCAEVLTETDVVCPRCGFAAGDGYKYCANCGDEVMVGSVVCATCGQPVPIAPYMGQSAFMQQPSYQQPTYQQPGYQQPTYQQPTYQQPGYQQPGYQQMPGQPPAYQTRALPPAAPGYGQQAPGTYNPTAAYGPVTYKSKVAAGVLGILLGSLGIHNFYLGYTGKGVAQLLLTVATCGVGAIVSEIWGFIEGIMILTGSINTDGRGLPLKE